MTAPMILAIFLGLTGIVVNNLISCDSSSVSSSSSVKPVMTQQVTAQVILRSRNGLSILDTDESITSENAAAYKVDDATKAQVSQQLTSYGFQVGQAGPYSLSITGDKTLFEQVFQTQLQQRNVSSSELGAKVYYQALNPLQPPEELSSQIAAVTLSKPPEILP